MNTRMRLGASALIAFAAGALAAACSSSPAANPTPAASGNSLAAYTSCLQRNGVTLPSFAGSGRGPGAFASGRPSFSPGATRSRGPGGGGTGGGSGGGTGSGRGGDFGGGFLGTRAPAGVDQATWTKATQACSSLRPTARPSGSNGGGSANAAYRNCLADHGVTVTAGPVNTTDPAYVAAEKACAPLRPSPRPRPSGTPAG